VRDLRNLKTCNTFCRRRDSSLRPRSIFRYCCTQKRHQGFHHRHRLLVHGVVDHLPLHEIIHRHHEREVTSRRCQFTRIQQPASCTGTFEPISSAHLWVAPPLSGGGPNSFSRSVVVLIPPCSVASLVSCLTLRLR
jgi:hypothetical protein